MTTHPMHLFDPALKGLKGKPKRPVHLSPTTQNDVFLNALLEMPTTKTVRRSPLEWAAATGLHVVILTALVHNGDDPTGQVRRHSGGGPSCRAAPTSTSGGAGGGSARNIHAPESHLQTRKTNCTGFDSEDGLAG